MKCDVKYINEKTNYFIYISNTFFESRFWDYSFPDQIIENDQKTCIYNFLKQTVNGSLSAPFCVLTALRPFGSTIYKWGTSLGILLVSKYSLTLL